MAKKKPDPVQKEDPLVTQFKKRLGNPPKRIDNSSLRAGAPMYFYCRYCGQISDVLPESYIGQPNHVCGDCSEMERAGVSPARVLAEIRNNEAQ